MSHTQVLKKIYPKIYNRLCPNNKLSDLAELVKEWLSLERAPPVSGRAGGPRGQPLVSYPVVGWVLVDDLEALVAADIAAWADSSMGSTSTPPAVQPPRTLVAPPQAASASGGDADSSTLNADSTTDCTDEGRLSLCHAADLCCRVMVQMAITEAVENRDGELAHAMTEAAIDGIAYVSAAAQSVRDGGSPPVMPPSLSSSPLLDILHARTLAADADAADAADDEEIVYAEEASSEEGSVEEGVGTATAPSLVGKQVRLETGELASVRADLGRDGYQVDVDGLLSVMKLGNRGGEKKYTVVGDAPPPPFASPSRAQGRASRRGNTRRASSRTPTPTPPLDAQAGAAAHSPAAPLSAALPSMPQAPPANAGLLRQLALERESRTAVLSSSAPPRAPLPSSANRSGIHTTSELRDALRCVDCEGIATVDNPLVRCFYADKSPERCDRAWHRHRCAGGQLVRHKVGQYVCCMAHSSRFARAYPGEKYVCPDATDAALPPIPPPPPK